MPSIRRPMLARRLTGAVAVVIALALAAPAPAAPTASVQRPQSQRTARPAAARRTPATKPAPVDSAQLVAESREARRFEEEGDYARAAGALRALRAHSRPDADLELWLALDEARSGDVDSAWARLAGPLLTRAMADSGSPARWREYGTRRNTLWLNGRFDGWHWYVARAKAELALALGRSDDALAAARVAARSQPLCGREQLLLAIAAGRAGELVTAREAAQRAAELDPLLPEAEYLRGLWAWRDGDRARARASFQTAIAMDSSYRAPALALVRLQLPGTRPDSLPGSFLHGARRIALLSAPERPKLEDLGQTDTQAGLYGSAPSLTIPDSTKRVMGLTKPIKLLVTVLVAEDGRAVLDYFPYLDPKALPPSLLRSVLDTAKNWRFRPATRFGQPVRAWVTVEYMLNL